MSGRAVERTNRLKRSKTTNLAEQLRELQYQGVQATLLIHVCAIVLHMGQ